jgi:hypothetical protein
LTATHVLLVVIGWPVEVVGVLCVAAPDWWPPTREALARGWSHVRRFLRRPVIVKAGTATAHAHAHGVAVGTVSLPADADVERRVAFLMERVELLQRRLGHVENEVAEGLERRWTEAIDAASRDLRTEMATGLAEVRGEYLRIRQVGLVLLVVGGAMLAAANLV